jgi:hypothetical protein
MLSTPSSNNNLFFSVRQAVPRVVCISPEHSPNQHKIGFKYSYYTGSDENCKYSRSSPRRSDTGGGSKMPVFLSSSK